MMKENDVVNKLYSLPLDIIIEKYLADEINFCQLNNYLKHNEFDNGDVDLTALHKAKIKRTFERIQT